MNHLIGAPLGKEPVGVGLHAGATLKESKGEISVRGAEPVTFEGEGMLQETQIAAVK